MTYFHPLHFLVVVLMIFLYCFSLNLGGGGQYDGSYGGGQRQYNENSHRGGGGQRGGPNPNYRGNR